MNRRIELSTFIWLSSLLVMAACTPKRDAPTPVRSAWRQLPAISNVFREEASSFAIGANAYFGLGFGNTDGQYRANTTYNNDIWAFTPNTTNWRRVADFPGDRRSRAISFALNERGYLAFGYSTNCPADGGNCRFTYYTDVWEYNPLTNTWTKVADFNTRVARYADAFVINNKAYFLTDSECYEFDPATKLFLKRKPCPIGNFSGAFSLANKGYVLLGSPDTEQNRAVYEYTPETDTWSRKKDFPGPPRMIPANFSLNGYGYCGGGYRSGNPQQYFRDFWKYDPTTDAWTQLEDYPGIGSVWLQSIVIENGAIIGSGYGYTTGQFRYDNNFWLFQPK